MLKTLLVVFFTLCSASGVFAEEPLALDDSELSQVSGADGIGIAMHLELNDPHLTNPGTDSRISMGFTVDGKTNYIVIKNLRGMIDMAALDISVKHRPDGGGDYVAVGLPGFVKYTNFGFESLSVQTDPLAAVTNSLGRVNVNGTVSMQGEFRFWAH
jgi:hypothetical protein